MRKLYIMTTGGTIEKEYLERTGVVSNTVSKIDRYLRRLRLPAWGIRIVPIMNIDSLCMVESDRASILASVKTVLKQRAPIVITHGTDTLVKTGLFLQKTLPNLRIPIIMTGAMTPLGFEGSDGLQNLTESIFAAQLLPPGVYVVIHGQVFPIHRTRKEPGLCRFVVVKNPKLSADITS